MGRGEKEKGRWWKENEGKEVEEEVDRWRVGRRVFRAMGNETWSLVLCLWNIRIKRKRNILVAWKVKELRDWKETPDDTYIYTRMVRRADVPGDKGMDRKWMDFLQQFVRWMTVWVVKWDFVTVEFEEIGEGLDGFKFGKFGSLLLVEELVDGSVIWNLDGLLFEYFKNWRFKYSRIWLARKLKDSKFRWVKLKHSNYNIQYDNIKVQ